MFNDAASIILQNYGLYYPIVAKKNKYTNKIIIYKIMHKY